MKLQLHLSTQKISALIIACVLLGICAGLRMLPANLRDDSGEAYIVIALLLANAIGLIVYALQNGHKKPTDKNQNQ